MRYRFGRRKTEVTALATRCELKGVARLAHDVAAAGDLDTGSTWPAVPGDELVPGYQAWELLGQGRRFELWLVWDSRR